MFLTQSENLAYHQPGEEPGSCCGRGLIASRAPWFSANRYGQDIGNDGSNYDNSTDHRQLCV